MIKGFFVMRSAADGDFEKIAFVENKKRTYKDSHFNSATAYAYKIIAQNLRGILGHDSPVLEVKPKTLPAPPADLSFSIAYNTLTLSWKGPEEGISYNIYKSSVKDSYPDAPLNGKPVQGRSFRDSSDMNKPVYYTVRSITGDGVKYEGPASAELSVDPREFVPSRPGDLRAAATEDSVSLVWNEPAETWITGYRVYRETNKKQGFVLLGETQVPTYTDKEKPASRRSYRVTAVGPVKEGPAAEVRNIIYIKPRKPR